MESHLRERLERARAFPSPRFPLSTAALILALLTGAMPGVALPARAGLEDGTWIPQGAPGPGLVVYDSDADRVLLLGAIADVHQFPLAGPNGWSTVPAAGTTPAASLESSIAYDPVRNRLLVFDGGITPRLWALSLGATPTWTLITPPGAGPAIRRNATCLYDPLRDRLLIYGGQYSQGGPPPAVRSDVWAVSLSGSPSWNVLATSGTTPPGRGLHGAIYDPVRDRIIVHAGIVSGAYQSSDLWALSLSGSPTWTQIIPAGIMPAARNSPVTIYDAVGDRVIMTNGVSLSGFGSATDVWSLPLSGAPGWIQLAGSVPTATSHGLYDPIRNRLILKGVSTWARSLTSSTTATLSSDAGPPHLEYPKASYDAARDRMIVIGQSSGPQMWELSLGAGSVWNQIASGGPPHRGHAQVYDPSGDRIVVFGGEAGATYFNDLWKFDTGGNDWVQITGVSTPPTGRTGASAIYDPLRDRMIIFGGYNPNTFADYFDDVWALTLSGSPYWTQIATIGLPPSGRRDHVAIYDPIRDQMLVFGGISAAAGYDNSVAALDLSGDPIWHTITPSGSPPSGRSYASGIYDPDSDALVIFGGAISQSLDENDVWKLSLGGGTPEWTELSPSGTGPGNARESAAVYDPGEHRMVIHSAYLGGPGTWSIDWSDPAPVSVTSMSPAGLGISSLVSSPHDGTPAVRFSLPVAGSASLRIFDLQGRRAGSRDVGGLGAGAHRLLLPELASLPSGVYILRLEQNHRAATARAVIVR